MNTYKARLFVITTIITSICFMLVLRLGYLFIVQKKFFKQQGDARTVRVITTPAYRGLILDRNERPLAVSTAVATIWANPSFIYDEDGVQNYDYSAIDKLLKLPEKYTVSKLQENKSKEFIYLKRHIPPDTAQKVEQLSLPGIYIKKEFKRYYPSGEVAAHITGFTSIDEQGQEGLEYIYEDKLRGVPSKKEVLKDRLGQIVKTIKQQSIAKPGDNIQLSIDLRLQYLTYKSLKESIDKHDASAGIAVVVNIKTGEILALANQPSFNPNHRLNIVPSDVRNRAITDLFEPGSLLKPLSMAALLSTNKVAEDLIVDTNPGYIKIGKNIVKDVRNYGELSIDSIIKKSSNVGISKLTLEYDSGDLEKLLYKVGFGHSVFNEFPGEASGWINTIQEGEKFKLATLSFGYGIAVTPLQLLQSYSIFANNGKFVPLTINKQDSEQEIKHTPQIIQPELANKILGMLHGVMQLDGTGRLAMVPNYHTVGKTGTTRRLSKDGYDDQSHNAMIIGMAPYPDPKFAMLVFVIDPKKNGYYGGRVAGPVFKQVMSRLLQLYSIPPQKVA